MLNIVANSVSGDYRIANSLRFRSSASAYLSRTFGTPTNTYKFTFSFWMKRGVLSAQENFLGSNTYPNYMVLSIGASDQLQFVYGGTNAYGGYTTAVFRDPSAWYHIVYAVDTTQATDSNRVKIYVNGVQQTAITTIPGATATYPPQNTANPINSSSMVNEIAATNYTGTNTQFFDGYLADINFIDGQALSPTAFGQYSPTTGVWIPASYTGTYGTNGFHLNFSNGTSTTTLGYDSSGNGNNWTTNNISLTAGSTYDWMIDSPTSFAGSSYGVGNYCVWNPLSGTYGTLSNANTYFVGPADYATRMGTLALPTTGKWYYEATISTAPYTPRGSTSGYNWIGVALSTNFNIHYVTPNGANVNGVMLGDNGYINNFTTSVTDTGSGFALNDVIGIAIDTGANTYAFYKNGVSIASGTMNVTAGTSLSPMILSYDASYGAMQANFGQRPFAFSPPSGYKSLCTYNLPTPSIVNGGSYMAATTYTGTGATQSIVNAGGFQPDLVWTKARSAAIAGLMYDSVRGATKYLQTNSTGAEGTGADSLTAFVTNGFTAGADTSTTGVNQNGTTYVGWQWKAGGAAVTNNAGSITSQVSANTTAGFSVVTFTEPASGSVTVGHGIGIAPSFIVLKSRANTSQWVAYHSALSNTQYLLLNLTNAATTSATVWNSTSPTSSVFSVGTDFNGLGNMVAYCFAAIAGYSAFGSYTGNGSADGPFVYCGFRPRFVLIKGSSYASNWNLIDTARDPYNVESNVLRPNLSNAESSDTSATYGISWDGLSNGFKLRNGSGTNDANQTGQTYIYAAFAENPFQNALAR